MTNNHWLTKDTAYLIENYETMSFYEMAEEMGVEYKRVKDHFIKLRRMGVIPKSAKAKFGRKETKKWSSKEIKLLETMIVEEATIDEIYDTFSDRTKNSVEKYFYFIKKKAKETYKNKVCDEEPVVDPEIGDLHIMSQESDDITLCNINTIIPNLPEISTPKHDEKVELQPRRTIWLQKFGVLGILGNFFRPEKGQDMKKMPIWKSNKKSSVWKTPIEEL